MIHPPAVLPPPPLLDPFCWLLLAQPLHRGLPGIPYDSENWGGGPWHTILVFLDKDPPGTDRVTVRIGEFSDAGVQVFLLDGQIFVDDVPRSALIPAADPGGAHAVRKNGISGGDELPPGSPLDPAGVGYRVALRVPGSSPAPQRPATLLPGLRSGISGDTPRDHSGVGGRLVSGVPFLHNRGYRSRSGRGDISSPGGIQNNSGRSSPTRATGPSPS